MAGFATQQTCFNSKMVRLKVTVLDILSVGDRMFQFQNGSIKSMSKDPAFLFYPKFQFQNGSIKRLGLKSGKKYYFLFQFQNGSIKRNY